MPNLLAKKKCVTVKFIGDEDFIENITNLEQKESGKNQKREYDIKYDQIQPEEISDEDVDENFKPPTILSQTEDEVEEEGYSMPIVSTSKGKKPRGRPKLSVGKPGSKKTPKTPKSSVKKIDHANSAYSLRAKKSTFLNEQEWVSDLEDSNSDMSDGSEDGSSANETAQATGASTSPHSKKKKGKIGGDDYFAAQKNKKSATSNRTMTKVSMPKTNIEDLRQLLSNVPEYHAEAKVELNQNYENMFEKWMFLLEEGFNLLLYGIGSKIDLLQNFSSKCLTDETVITINGFFPSLSIKQILNSITEQVIETDKSFTSFYEQTEFIKEHLISEDEEIYIVINNIDGTPLRCIKTQAVLSSLASCENIHFVASVDHINCSLIWDQITLSRFQWLWFNVPTYEPYILELSYENSLLQKQSHQLLLSSLMHVFQSLTPNNQGVFLILAKYQMDKKDSGNYLGITFNDWYQECREAFLVNSKTTMNAQISEFKNHKLLSSRKSSEGIEYWYIPVDNQTLAQFIEKNES